MTRQFTSYVIFFVPVLILNVLRFVVTPLGEMMKISIELDLILHAIALVIGFFLARKARVIRDHEWQRSKAVKSVDSHFKAEDKGVWEKEVHMDPNLSTEAEANMKGQVASVTTRNINESVEIDTEVEVEMLIDSEHVLRAQNRISGNEQFDGGTVDVTIGAVRKKSPMDSFLDWINGLFGRDTAAERESKKAASLQMRSEQSPVIAQRPIAPVQPIKAEHPEHPLVITSITDDGEHTDVVSIEDALEMPKDTQSLEEMAYGLPQEETSETALPIITGKNCSSCGSSNEPDSRFCDNCGSNL